jgi:magnesium transporter
VAARHGAVSETRTRTAASGGLEAPSPAPPAAPAGGGDGSSGAAGTAGQAAAARGLPRSHYRDENGALHRDLGPRAIAEAVAKGTGALWVDIDSTNRAQLAVLENVFHFHPLSIEDTLNPNTRVKIEEFPDYLFIAIRVVSFCDDTPDDPYDIETSSLCFFLGKNFLVTVHTEQSPAVAAMEDRMQRSPDFLSRGVERLMHAITDAAVDGFFPILDQIDEFLDDLEERVFVSFDQAALREIFTVKRLVLALRRHLAPQREVFNVLTNRPTSLLAPETQVYFRDVYDHVLRINDALDTYRELLSSVLDSYLSQVSNRLGATSKTLALVGALSVPFVVVSGMWGMNFRSIPMAGHPAGFWLMLALQLGLGAALVGVLRWRKWL